MTKLRPQPRDEQESVRALREDPIGREMAIAGLSQVWPRRGFKQFLDGVYVLDLNRALARPSARSSPWNVPQRRLH